jgi:alpha,alpha-trehalase
VISNYEKTGVLWEKYNAVTGTTKVADEYKMPSMVGWTAGVFVFAREYLIHLTSK